MSGGFVMILILNLNAQGENKRKRASMSFWDGVVVGLNLGRKRSGGQRT
jgi:hypothetical protein